MSIFRLVQICPIDSSAIVENADLRKKSEVICISLLDTRVLYTI